MALTRFLNSRLGQLAVFGLVLIAWQIWATSSTDGLIPPVTNIVEALWDQLTRGDLPAAFLESNKALFLGLLISILLGVPFGIACGRIPWIDSAAAPYIHLAMVLPMVALVPVVIIFLGLDLKARVAVVVLFAFPDIVINVRAGARSIQPALLEMAKSFGGAGLRIWRGVLVPAAFPAIMTAIRIGIGRGIMGMVVVELTLIATGMGEVIMNSLGSFQAASMFAVIIVVGLEALVLTALATRAERAVRLRMGAVQ